jgi:hypothetical protein
VWIREDRATPLGSTPINLSMTCEDSRRFFHSSTPTYSRKWCEFFNF